MAAPDICVIYNPAAGRGRAGKRVESLRRLLGPRADFQATRGPGHGEQLALQAAQAGYSIVAAAGGDGTVHEVANGILRGGQADVALAVLPVGSANDYAYSLGQDETAVSRTVDVGYVQTPEGRARYFVNGLGLGFNGAVTLESRRIRRLQGVPLYAAALLRALWLHYACPLLTITLDGVVRQVPTLALSVNLGQREGSFLLTPQARLDDGLFDYLHAGALGRWELLRFLPRMITGRLPTDHPAVWIGRCQQVSLCSETALLVHVDGEFFSRPEDQVRSLAIQLLPGRLRVHCFTKKGSSTEPI